MRIDWRKLAWRPIPFAIVGALLLRERGAVDATAPSRNVALARVLEKRGMRAMPDGVAWIERSSGISSRTATALIRAAEHDDPLTVWMVPTRLSPEGVLIDVDTPHRLTRSTGVEESAPAVHGTHVATALVAEGAALGVQLFDLAGEPRLEGPEWTTVPRIQNSLTNLQDTGQLAGVGRRSFQLVPPASDLVLRFDHGQLVVSGDGKEARAPEVLPDGVNDADDPWLRPQPTEKGQLGNLATWSVDRVRAMPWFGDENMQRLKAVAFSALDLFTRAKSTVTTDDTAKDIANDMGVEQTHDAQVFTDPETGWPPPPIEPLFKKPIPGEGEWILLGNDPFVQVNTNAPPAFATTFVRTDRERPYTRIYVTVWDPRQVEIHPVAGTVEPVSATGNAGPGVIPRTPEVMKRVVGALNGGFQAMHGEFGMMADGVVYLPPKPFGASVVQLRDGSTGFGVWPNSTEIPEDVVGFRQNLTPLVLDEKMNPYGRSWWGGTPPGWPDRVHTTRSGICLTREKYVAYFYGNGIDADVLGQAMIQARCKLGIHLDMNPGHTGLEFYRAAPQAEWTPFGRAYQLDWETEGEVGSMDHWRFRARRMIRGMGLMNFPRYIQRESRDFFYLLLRPVLPGKDVTPEISPPEANEGKWRTKGLPQQGFPFAVATTLVRPDPARADLRARLLQIDPHTVALATKADDGAKDVVVLQNVERTGDASLWLGNSGFAIGKEGTPKSSLLLSGALPGHGGGDAKAIVGIHDDDGMLLYAEVETGAGAGDIRELDKLLSKLGCTSRLWLSSSLAPLLGGGTTLAGAPGKRSGAASSTVRLVRIEAPGGRSLFPDTPIVPQSEWGPLQMKRIRYFKHAEGEKKDAPEPEP